MSYQVLARKWRPRNFSEVVGQQHVLQALTNALTHQRLHHAYLLTGTRGVGKTTIARILSRSLNCDKGITATPCGECSACVDIEAGRFVDLMEIDAASRTKVEDTREILENVQYRPTAGRYKVYLIDEVHMLSRHSFNALLKTLEEPPPHVIFLLATTDPEKLPVTVLSRCLQFNLRALTRDEISKQLQHILGAEKIAFDETALALLARSANGSMRDALSLTDQAIAQGNNEVREDAVARMLGRIDHANLLDLLAAVADGDVNKVLQSLRDVVDKIPDISGVLTELQTMLHQLALAQVAPALLDSELLGQREQLAALAQKIDPATVQVYYRTVLDGRRELPYAPDAFSGVEMTLLRMLAFRPALADDTAESAGSGAPTAGKHDAVATPATSAGAAISAARAALKEPAVAKEAVSSDTEEPSAQTAEPSAQTQEPSAQTEEPIAPKQPVTSEPPVVSQDTTKNNSATAEPEREYEIPEYLNDSDDDDDDSAALFAEQAGIEQQAQAVRSVAAEPLASGREPSDQDKEPSASSKEPSAQDKEPSFDKQQQQNSSVTSIESADLTSLMATRSRLAGKKNSESASLAANGSKATTGAASGERSTSARTLGSTAEEPLASSKEPSASAEPSAQNEPSANAEPVASSAAEPEAPASAPTPQNLANEDTENESAANENAANEQTTNASATTSPSGKVTAASQVDAWAAQIDKLAVVGRTRQVLLHSQLHEQADGYLLEVAADMQALLSGHMTASIKHELAAVITNKALEVKLGKPERTPFLIQQEIDGALQLDAEQRVAAHAGIQQLQTAFTAEIKQVKVLH